MTVARGHARVHVARAGARRAGDRRSDVYSAGMVLYHLLTGGPPFEGDSAYFVAMNTSPTRRAAVGPRGRQPRAGGVCLRAIRRRPDDRFDSAREMRAALRAALARSTPAGQAARGPRAGASARRAAAGATASRRRPNTTRRLLEGARDQAHGATPARRRDGASGWPPPRSSPWRSPAGLRGATDHGRRGRKRPPARHAVTGPPARDHRGRVRRRRSRPAEGARGGAAVHRPRGQARARKPARDRGLVRAAAVETAPSVTTASAAPPTAPAPAAANAIAPAPAPAAPTPLAAATATPPAPAPHIDVERATASIAGITTTSAIPSSSVRAALGRVPLARCYRDALRAGGMASGTATLRLRIDSAGYVTGAALQGAGIMPAMKGCIEKAATAMRIKDVDTGDATADVTLNFVATP